MNILWLTNVPLSIVRESISNNRIQMGGWLDGISEALIKTKEIQLTTIFPYAKDVNGKIGKVKYQSFIPKKEKFLAEEFKEIICENDPDIIHVFGTEMQHSLVMVNACKQLGLLDKLVINIQGLCGKIAESYYSGLPTRIVNSWTIRDLLRFDNIYIQRKKFLKRAKREEECLRIVKNVIGRTDFDKAVSLQTNPNLNYYFCNEILRDLFYHKEWIFDKCEKYSIFVSQSNYPLKGFHKVLEAVSIVKRFYPKVQLYVTGKNLFILSLKDKLKLTSYQKYLLKLVKKYNLKNCVNFLGYLDAENMCEQYLKSNCFVSASSNENSPNSLGEAMLLGVPCIASDVGGVRNFIEHNKNGYIYPFDEAYMLAYYICKVFNDGDCADISKFAKFTAREIYNKENNVKALINIYHELGQNSREII